MPVEGRQQVGEELRAAGGVDVGGRDGLRVGAGGEGGVEARAEAVVAREGDGEGADGVVEAVRLPHEDGARVGAGHLVASAVFGRGRGRDVALAVAHRDRVRDVADKLRGVGLKHQSRDGEGRRQRGEPRDARLSLDEPVEGAVDGDVEAPRGVGERVEKTPEVDGEHGAVAARHGAHEEGRGVGHAQEAAAVVPGNARHAHGPEGDAVRAREEAHRRAVAVADLRAVEVVDEVEEPREHGAVVVGGAGRGEVDRIGPRAIDGALQRHVDGRVGRGGPVGLDAVAVAGVGGKRAGEVVGGDRSRAPRLPRALGRDGLAQPCGRFEDVFEQARLLGDASHDVHHVVPDGGARVEAHVGVAVGDGVDGEHGAEEARGDGLTLARGELREGGQHLRRVAVRQQHPHGVHEVDEGGALGGVLPVGDFGRAGVGAGGVAALAEEERRAVKELQRRHGLVRGPAEQGRELPREGREQGAVEVGVAVQRRAAGAQGAAEGVAGGSGREARGEGGRGFDGGVSAHEGAAAGVGEAVAVGVGEGRRHGAVDGVDHGEAAHVAAHDRQGLPRAEGGFAAEGEVEGGVEGGAAGAGGGGPGVEHLAAQGGEKGVEVAVRRALGGARSALAQEAQCVVEHRVDARVGEHGAQQADRDARVTISLSERGAPEGVEQAHVGGHRAEQGRHRPGGAGQEVVAGGDAAVGEQHADPAVGRRATGAVGAVQRQQVEQQAVEAVVQGLGQGEVEGGDRLRAQVPQGVDLGARAGGALVGVEALGARSSTEGEAHVAGALPRVDARTGDVEDLRAQGALGPGLARGVKLRHAGQQRGEAEREPDARRGPPAGRWRGQRGAPSAGTIPQLGRPRGAIAVLKKRLGGSADVVGWAEALR